MPTKPSAKYLRHKVVDTCIGEGWRHMDIAYCGREIVTYQYRLERPQGDRTPLGLRHYTRCAECAAKTWHQRRLDDHGTKWRTSPDRLH